MCIRAAASTVTGRLRAAVTGSHLGIAPVLSTLSLACLRESGSKYPFVSSRHTMVLSPAVVAARAALASIDLTNYDAEQSRLMDERCILVDEDDNALGAADKKTCMYSRCR